MTGPVLRLFCLPYAGGSAAGVYRDWRRALPAGIDVVPVELPGRGTRLGELPYTRVESLLTDVLRAVLPRLDLPFALFGHSLGAILAFEAARRLEHAHDARPERLLVSGYEAPDLDRAPERDHLLPDEQFRERIRRLGGTPPEVLADTGLMDLLLPVLRADLAAAAGYAFRPGAPLSCPVTVFGGLDDPEARPSRLEGWRRQTTGPCAIRLLPGDHFFLHSAADALLPRVAADLAGAGRPDLVTDAPRGT